MTNNIDRAAEVIYRALNGKYGDFSHHGETADALANAGLLMPDLPEPDGDGRWWAGADGMEVRGGLIEHAFGLNARTLAPTVARRIALALLAAAAHAQKEETNE